MPASSTRLSAEEAQREIASFLEGYPTPIAHVVQQLRRAVLRAVPTAVEKLRPGWRLIGYDLPITRHGRYFAWVWPELEHVHVGWEVGTLMPDPEHLLRGAHLKLKKVRYLTFEPGARVAVRPVIAFTRDAARIASMSRSERELLARSTNEP